MVPPWHAPENLRGICFFYEDGAITGGVPDDPDTIRGFILAGETTDKIGVYTIPSDESAVAVGFGGGVEGRTAAIRLVTLLRPPGFVDFIEPSAGVPFFSTGNSGDRFTLSIPRGAPSGTQLKASARTDEAGTVVIGDFTIILIKNELLGI